MGPYIGFGPNQPSQVERRQRHQRCTKNDLKSGMDRPRANGPRNDAGAILVIGKNGFRAKQILDFND